MSTELPPSASSGVSFGPPADWVVTRERDDTFRAPAGAPESILLLDHQFHVAPRQAYTRVARRFETPAAVQEGSQWRCDFDPATQSVTIHSIAICRGDARMEQGSQARLRILQREENLERLMLDGTATIVLLLEDVRLGDVLDVSYTVSTRPRIFAEHFSTFITVPTWCHAGSFHARVQAPAGTCIQWKSDSKEMRVQQRELPNGEQELSWELPALKPVEPEAATPPWVLHAPYLQVSTFPSWAVVAEGVDAAWRSDFEHAEIQKCLEVIRQEPTILLRIEKALRWAQDDLRYLSVNTELGGQIPTNPGEVLQRRFGDCKDKSFLLAHLLRLLGVPARPVLVNSGLRHRIREFLPAANVFNHAIVEFEHEGNRRWVDATIPFQGGGPLGRSIPAYGFGLPIGPGVTDLEPIMRAPKVEDRYDSREILRLDAGTDIHLTTVVRATGRFADQMRYQHVFEGAAATDREREQFYQRLFNSARRLTPSEVRDNRDTNEFAFAETFQIPRVVVSVDQNAGVTGFRYDAHLIQQFLVFPDIPKRASPLALAGPCVIEQRIECEFPTLVQVGTRAGNLFTPQLTFDAKVRQAGDRTVFAYTLRLNVQEVEPEAFLNHRKYALRALGITSIPIYIARGARSAGRRRSPASLLPSGPSSAETPTVAEAQTAAAAAADVGGSPPPEAVPAETPAIAAALPSRAPTSADPATEARETPVTKRPPKPVKPEPVDAVVATTRRSRRSRRKSALKRVLLHPVVLFTLGLAVVLLIIVLSKDW